MQALDPEAVAPGSKAAYHAAAVLSAATILAGAPASAQSPEAFFKDKTVKIMVGHSPGGSYDFYARLAADISNRSAEASARWSEKTR